MIYHHKEAYCLMAYQCEDCGYVTNLWNSRDGVTPFITKCLSCGRPSQHVHFHLDKPFKKLPHTASGVFINTTKEKAIEISHKFWDKHGDKLLEEYEHLRKIGKDELIKNKINEIYRDGKQPYLLTRFEYLNLRFTKNPICALQEELRIVKQNAENNK